MSARGEYHRHHDGVSIFLEGEINGNHDVDDSDSIKDEEARRDIRVLSVRLEDLKERFMKIVEKINTDGEGFEDQTSDEGKRSPP